MLLSNINVFKFLRQRISEVRIFVVIFYSVGLAGILIPSTHSLFLQLTPLALLLSAFVLFVFYPGGYEHKHALVFLFIFLAGFLVEVAGVQSGLIFGSYQYGDTLGFKLFETPVIIGINWLILIYLTASILERFTFLPVIKIVLASLLMLVYDIILEQVAPLMEMWTWQDGMVPFRNYMAWFVLSLVFHSCIKFFHIDTRNRLAMTVFAIQFLFFLLLYKLL
jgi:putative membrane protein